MGATDEGGLGTGLAGRWRDPGQCARTGPCCLINPAEVTEIGRRQIEQDDLGTTSKLAPITRAAILTTCFASPAYSFPQLPLRPQVLVAR